MRPGMVPHQEDYLNARIDNERSIGELRGQGRKTEEFCALFFNGIPGFKTRFATPEEDKGPEIGGRQTVDLVVSFAENNNPAFAIQITSSVENGVIRKKLQEMRDHPFIKLSNTMRGDVAIPKVLVALDARQIKNFFENPDLAKYPELSIKVIDDIIRSLTFDLAQTQILSEKEAVQKLINVFEQEKKKYIH